MASSLVIVILMSVAVVSLALMFKEVYYSFKRRREDLLEIERLVEENCRAFKAVNKMLSVTEQENEFVKKVEKVKALHDSMEISVGIGDMDAARDYAVDIAKMDFIIRAEHAALRADREEAYSELVDLAKDSVDDEDS